MTRSLQPYSPVGAGKSANNLRCSIDRIVVENNQFQADMPALQYRTQGGSDIFFFVSRGD
jgi:hypothetical protein